MNIRLAQESCRRHSEESSTRNPRLQGCDLPGFLAMLEMTGVRINCWGLQTVAAD
jgi:hypothetical protein